jgi:hypothetical protein
METDLLLVDTKTGKTICAFDETVEGYQSRLSDKVARAKKNLIKGFGMRVKYGCTFKKNNGQTEIQLQEVTNIPPLFLAIQQKDLRELLQVMDFDIDSPLSSLEKNIISSMKEKMVTQIQELELSSSGKVSYDAVRDFLAHLHDRLMV